MHCSDLGYRPWLVLCSTIGIRENPMQAQTLAKLRDALLPRLISGQQRLPEVEKLLAGSDPGLATVQAALHGLALY